MYSCYNQVGACAWRKRYHRPPACTSLPAPAPTLCAPTTHSTPLALRLSFLLSQRNETTADCLSFEQHEWTSHGICGASLTTTTTRSPRALAFPRPLNPRPRPRNRPLTTYPPRTDYANTAGVTNAADFFTQVCDLATAPLAVMQASRDAGGDLSAMSAALTSAGYEVFDTDTSNSQLELSACATR